MRVKGFVLFALSLILAGTAWAATETVIYNFSNYTGDAAYPQSGLVADSDGNLYGTTEYGGGNNLGAVFELKLSSGTWTESLLYSFAGGTTDGEYPYYSALVFDKSGNIYGTTVYGGTENAGTVFELTPSGGGNYTETILHSFLSYAESDGSYPQAALSIDSSGNIFGTTQSGGKYNNGTIFEFTPSGKTWKYKLIHSFDSTDGGAYYPYGGITQGADGYYYGTTEYGGYAYNAGTIYRMFLEKSGWSVQNVFYFLEGGDGIYPLTSLTIDPTGNLYGTTYAGGSGEACGGGCGTVYKMTLGKTNKYTQSVIYSFQGSYKDGINPYYGADLAIDASGNLYGTTQTGGSTDNEGIVFELTPKKGTYKETVLHAFEDSSGDDGYYPRGGPILVNGKVYGTTYSGGTHGTGIVYEITP